MSLDASADAHDRATDRGAGCAKGAHDARQRHRRAVRRARAEDQDVALEAISERIQPGSPALVAEVTETAEAVVDETMAGLGGRVTRRPASEVYAEVASAQNASFEEGVDALKARIHEHRAERKDEWEAFKTKARAKMT